MAEIGKRPIARNNVEAIDCLIDMLSSARQRPQMYFDPIEPAEVENWLHGLKTGVMIFGLDWMTEHRATALAARGLALSAMGETDDLRQRGLSPSEIVNELLSIEIEMWQVHRASLV